MHFCSKCDNMYYVRISETDENKLIYYCRKCGNTDDIITEDNMCVSKTILKREEQKFSHIINEYTKLDATLPRVTNIKCPNPNCNEGSASQPAAGGAGSPQEKEIIYIRYDDINMKYVYICSACDTVWTLKNTK